MATGTHGNPKLIYEFGFGYSGTPLHYVDQNWALGICGNSLMYYSLAGAQNKHLMWGPGYGIQVTAYSPVLDYIAYALKDLKPVVHVYDCNINSEVAQLSELADLEVTCMAFSVDGSRLVTASSEPDFKLFLWEIDREKRTVTKLIGGQTDWCAMKVSFSPVSADRVCISGHGNLALWTYHRSFHRVSFTGKPLVAATFVPESHAWATHSDVIYVGCKEGELLSLNVKPPEPPKINAPSKEESKGRRGEKEKEKEQKKKKKR